MANKQEHFENNNIRPYGPSNYKDRPITGARTVIDRYPTPGENDGEKALAIETPDHLMREQAQIAIENGEIGPDSWWGAWWKISEGAGAIRKNDPEIIDWLDRNKDLIFQGLERYKSIPRDFIAKVIKDGKSHPRLLSMDSQTIIDWLSRYYELKRDGSLHEYADDFDTASYMLKFVAEYEDGLARTK